MIKALSNNRIPNIDESCFVADDSHISGQVTLGEMCSIWFKAVLRADVNSITIGKYTNVQDGSVIHVNKEDPVVIGDYVTIGHGAMLHGCTIHDDALIGIGAIVLDNAEIGKGSWVAAGTLVPPGKKIPEGVLVMGNPCKIVRELKEDEIRLARERCIKYAEIYPNAYK